MIQNLSLEKRIPPYLNSQDEEIKKWFYIKEDHTDDYDFPDYLLNVAGKDFWLECKEREKVYDKRWNEFSNIELNSLFVIDERSIRMLSNFTPNYVILIYDQFFKYYYLFYHIDVLLMKKDRCNRPAQKNKNSEVFDKGKCIIDLNDGYRYRNLGNAMRDIYDYVEEKQNKIMIMNECYDKNNIIKTMGKEAIRKPEYWIIDLKNK